MGNNLASGLVIAAPSSTSGKTIITLGLLRVLKNSGISVGSFKIGPDFIDPTYHSAASGKICHNLDFWCMRPETLVGECIAVLANSTTAIAEGVMGLFDGAVTGQTNSSGSTADAAKWLGWPVVLVINASGQGASVAALVQGFVNYRPDINVAGVIFNSVGSSVHEKILKDAISAIHIPCVGCIPRDDNLILPHRHLGLIPAQEMSELDFWLDQAANIIADHVDFDLLNQILKQSNILPGFDQQLPVPRLGNHTAIALDDAFSFCYEHIISAWRSAGVKISFFSPLADEAPDLSADSVFLPGGYPELHAAKLANNNNFKQAMILLATRDAVIYGECGGFMVLGETLTDRDGKIHDMIGLLPVETSFENPALHLGYRQLSLISNGALGDAGDAYRGHEFHYCDITSKNSAKSLFHVNDAQGNARPEVGCHVGNVMGSFVHIVDSV